MNWQVQMKIEDSVLIAGGHAWHWHTRESKLRALPWHFTEKEAISFSGQGRVPVFD
jgi:hypothetical protein